jgi:hypothetical protein
MKTHKYILSRILTLVIAIIIIYNGAYYTLPKYLQEDRFSFVSELDRIFELSLIFSIIFLLFLLVEIYIFNKREQTNLRSVAMIFSFFTTIVVIALFYINGIN